MNFRRLRAAALEIPVSSSFPRNQPASASKLLDTMVGTISQSTSHCRRQEKIEFDWSIPDFISRVQNKGVRRLESPEFTFLDCTWHLFLLSDALRAFKEFEVELRVKDGQLGGDKDISCNIWVKTSCGARNWTVEESGTFRQCGEVVLGVRVDGLDIVFLQERRSEFLPSGTLTIVCTLQGGNSKFMAEMPQESSRLGMTSQPTSKMDVPAELVPRKLAADITRLSTDLRGLLLSGDDSDAIVRVKRKKFRVHRAILGARAPVFRAMLRHETTERGSGVVDILDSEPDVFCSFLEYVYSGQVEGLTAVGAILLYEFAHKYQLESLKRKCLDVIKGGLSADNFTPAINLAILYDETELATVAKRFFASNIKDVIQSDTWRIFLCENPVEANDLLIKAHRRK